MRRTLVVNVAIVLLIILLAPVLIIGLIWWQTGELPQFTDTRPPQIPPAGAVETVTLPPGGTVTMEGNLTLVVEGSVPASPSGLRDLFYVHTDEFGLPLDEPVLAEPLLAIDGTPPEIQPYNPFHVYEIAHNASGTPLVLSWNGEMYAGERRMRVFVVPVVE